MPRFKIDDDIVPTILRTLTNYILLLIHLLKGYGLRDIAREVFGTVRTHFQRLSVVSSFQRGSAAFETVQVNFQCLFSFHIFMRNFGRSKQFDSANARLSDSSAFFMSLLEEILRLTTQTHILNSSF